MSISSKSPFPLKTFLISAWSFNICRSIWFPIFASFLHLSKSSAFRLFPWAASACSQCPFEKLSKVVIFLFGISYTREHTVPVSVEEERKYLIVSEIHHFLCSAELKKRLTFEPVALPDLTRSYTLTISCLKVDSTSHRSTMNRIHYSILVIEPHFVLPFLIGTWMNGRRETEMKVNIHIKQQSTFFFSPVSGFLAA